MMVVNTFNESNRSIPVISSGFPWGKPTNRAFSSLQVGGGGMADAAARELVIYVDSPQYGRVSLPPAIAFTVVYVLLGVLNV